MLDALEHPSSRLIHVDGIDLHYLDVGSGTPLLLVHGLGHSAVSWHRNLDALSSKFRVLALDLPGYGLSACPPDAAYDPPFFASIVTSFLRQIGVDNVNAVGCSAGGLAVLLAALENPDLFRRIVLVDSVGFTPAPGNLWGDALLNTIGLWLSLPRARPLIKFWYGVGFYDAAAIDEETVSEIYGRRVHSASMRASRRALTEFFKFSRNLQPLHDRLPQLKTPVLVIWGKNDRMFPVKDTQVAKRLMPATRIEWLDRCGHCPQLEQPAAFNSLVLDFLKAS